MKGGIEKRLLKQSPIFSVFMTADPRVVTQAMEKQQYFAGDCIFEIGDQWEDDRLIHTPRLLTEPALPPATRSHRGRWLLFMDYSRT